MPDDLLKNVPEDGSRISTTEPDQVQYWADKFGVSKERLLEAVSKVGYSPQAIGRELKRVSKDRDAGGGPGKARSGR
jgi:hypothetical protein